MSLLNRFVFLIVSSLFLLTSCGGNKGDDTIVLHRESDLGNARISVITGTTHEKYVMEHFPNAKINRVDTFTDLYLSLNSNKSDAIFVEYIPHKIAFGSDDKYRVFIKKIVSENYAMAFNKEDTELKDHFNEFLKEVKSNGIYDSICTNWIDNFENASMPDFSNIPRSGESIKIATACDNQGFFFIKNGRKSGVEAELLERFAAHLERPIEFSIINFGGLIAALSAGTVDIACNSLCPTPERSKQVDFSDPYYSSFTSVVIKNDNTSKGFSSLESASKSTIGVLLGSAQDDFITKTYPLSNIIRVDESTNLIQALLKKKCDVIVLDYLETINAMKINPEVSILENDIYTTGLHFGFRKGDPLSSMFNNYLKQIRESGEYDQLLTKWNIDDVSGQTIDNIEYQENAKSVVVGSSAEIVPYNFVINNQVSGLDIDIISRFLASVGMRPEFNISKFGSLIPLLQSRKIDIIASSLMKTEERSKVIDFSDSYYDFVTCAACLKTSLSDSFEGESLLKNDGSDIDKAKVGVMTGSLGDFYMKDHFPDAKINCFDDITDAITALSTNKVKYVMTSYTNAINAIRNTNNIIILDKNYTKEGAAIAFRKDVDKVFLNSVNSAISELKSDGTLDEMAKRWMDPINNKYQDVNIPITNDGKEWHIAVSANREPMCFVKDNVITGFDAELIQRVANKIERKVIFHDMKFSALTASLISGKTDAIVSNFTATQERAKVVTFSEEYFSNPQILLASKTNGKDQIIKKPWYKKIEESFINNIILEKRYLIILDGLYQTIIISIFAILLGTLLGAIVCYLRMSKVKLFSTFAKVYIDLMRGIPILVLLMIIFYVVFAKVNISATIVAIITFAMNFAGYVSEMFRTSIESIDKGQKEAGIALGFSGVRTFQYIIMPQARARVLPIYKGEVISLVKMTSVVGYIAVQDLTKASDIIRSRTFDAFFPLIVITILYFILAWLFGKALDLLNKKKQYNNDTN